MSIVTPEEIVDLFNIPHRSMKNVYLLGSFARRVTLYAQQVRALNLVYALHKTNKFRAGSRVAVVGAGASGLMAAAAAAYLGASVTLIEELQGPVELQRSSRIRWIDPFIYDWPLTETSGTRANLPFLDWEAAYAEKVSEQIEEKWKAIADSPQYKIECYWDIRADTLTFQSYAGKVRVSCVGRYNNESTRALGQAFDAVVLAVGFGVEPEHNAKYSYWSDDNLDGGFMTNREGQDWLVSGCGDGGLTDLMRLCIHRFRHGRMIDIFAGVKNIDAVKDQLVKAHIYDLPTKKTVEEQEDFLSDLFNDIMNRYDLLPLYDQVHRRRNMPQVFLTGDGPTPYGPNSSILNRLIVCQLQRHGAFQYLQGRAKITRVFSEQSYLKREVEFAEGIKRTFHRVIERHGTDKAIGKPCFDVFRAGLDELKERWDRVFVAGDRTREKFWEPHYFGTTPSAHIDRRERAFEAGVREIGIRVGALTITKQLGNTGGSTLNYRLERVSVLSGQLSRIRFAFRTAAGIVDDLKLDAEADRLGIVWVSDPREPAVGTLEERIECLGRISGHIEFRPALVEGSNVTFGFSFKVFNGDALSKWEFEQMYHAKDRCHINGEDLGNDIEYLARIVWFPVETLRIKIILPERVSTPPFLSVFQYNDLEHIPKCEVVDDKGVLQVAPSPGTSFHPRPNQGRTTWVRVDDPLLAEAGMTKLSNTASQTWELTVSKPLIGSCYSLDWVLDNPAHEFDALAERACELRARLLRHRQHRLAGEPGLPIVRECFEELRGTICERFAPLPGELFEVSIMTYDETKRVLVPVEGMVGDSEFPKYLWDTAIPFGLGLAGASFKESEILFRVADPPVMFPFYLSLPDSPNHQFLLSVPLDHPDLDHPDLGISDVHAVPDRSRQCIAVLNVGTFSEKTNMGMLPSSGIQLADVGQKFCTRLRDMFTEDRPI